MFSGIKTQVFEKGRHSGIFWKRALSVFVWTDANAGFRSKMMPYIIQRMPCEGCYRSYFQLSRRLEYVTCGRVFFENREKKIPFGYVLRLLYYTSLLQKIYWKELLHNNASKAHIKGCNRLHLHCRHYKILYCIKLYIPLSKNSTGYLLVKDGKSLRRI